MLIKINENFNSSILGFSIAGKVVEISDEYDPMRIWEELTKPFHLFVKRYKCPKIATLPKNYSFDFEIINKLRDEKVVSLTKSQIDAIEEFVYNSVYSCFNSNLKDVTDQWMNTPNKNNFRNYYKNNGLFVYNMNTEKFTPEIEKLVKEHIKNIGGNCSFNDEGDINYTNGLEMALRGIEKIMMPLRFMSIDRIHTMAIPRRTKKYNYTWYRLSVYHAGKRIIQKRGNVVPHSFLEVWKNVLETIRNNGAKNFIVILCFINYNEVVKSEPKRNKKEDS